MILNRVPRGYGLSWLPMLAPAPRFSPDGTGLITARRPPSRAPAGRGLASRVGFEPTTQGLKVPCSASELPARAASVADGRTVAASLMTPYGTLYSSIDAFRSRRWRRKVTDGSSARALR